MSPFSLDHQSFLGQYMSHLVYVMTPPLTFSSGFYRFDYPEEDEGHLSEHCINVIDELH
ncbi:MAG TPA: hypothetical protein VEF33_11210 [Syntrophales bacterium]|nr:hypothetical protein [Syntrophales bacterium]